ncbi:hypothetical protein B0I37DRAFT_241349 [Chaetomium sp. MPI-CAGE-AT-0009]|nr:hypothetical protein B0I37DRAFT_241349 [Chaetomium sp. MPI-CAGE-AT-0009]
MISGRWRCAILVLRSPLAMGVTSCNQERRATDDETWGVLGWSWSGMEGIINLGDEAAWIISLYSLCHDMSSNRTTRMVMANLGFLLQKKLISAAPPTFHSPFNPAAQAAKHPNSTTHPLQQRVSHPTTKHGQPPRSLVLLPT